MLACSRRVSAALESAETVDATVVNMRFINPLDTDMITDMEREHRLIVSVEDNVLQGGAGSAVNEYILQQTDNHRTINLA